MNVLLIQCTDLSSQALPSIGKRALRKVPFFYRLQPSSTLWLEHLADGLDVVLAEDVVVRMVQESFDLVLRNPEAAAMRGFDVGVEVVEQRFDCPPE